MEFLVFIKNQLFNWLFCGSIITACFLLLFLFDRLDYFFSSLKKSQGLITKRLVRVGDTVLELSKAEQDGIPFLDDEEYRLEIQVGDKKGDFITRKDFFEILKGKTNVIVEYKIGIFSGNMLIKGISFI